MLYNISIIVFKHIMILLRFGCNTVQGRNGFRAIFLKDGDTRLWRRLYLPFILPVQAFSQYVLTLPISYFDSDAAIGRGDIHAY